MSYLTFIGIDVSGQTLEIASSREHATWQVSNDGEGIERLVKELTSIEPKLIVLEAMGGHEFEAACALQASGLTVELRRAALTG